MSKKDKSKFKRQIKAQLSQQMMQAQSTQIQPVKKRFALPRKNEVSSVQTELMISSAPGSAVSSPAMASGEINLVQVKYDLKKTGIIVGILALMMAIIYYINIKHEILLTFGNWLFKVLHIG